MNAKKCAQWAIAAILVASGIVTARTARAWVGQRCADVVSCPTNYTLTPTSSGSCGWNSWTNIGNGNAVTGYTSGNGLTYLGGALASGGGGGVCVETWGYAGSSAVCVHPDTTADGTSHAVNVACSGSNTVNGYGYSCVFNH